MILNQLGIFGWREADENLLIASLLTGDPLLLIGNHGCAKTHVAQKMGEALGRRFLVYDASKAMFEDVLGYPNVEKLKHGIVEYVPSPVFWPVSRPSQSCDRKVSPFIRSGTVPSPARGARSPGTVPDFAAVLLRKRSFAGKMHSQVQLGNESIGDPGLL